MSSSQTVTTTTPMGVVSVMLIYAARGSICLGYPLLAAALLQRVSRSTPDLRQQLWQHLTAQPAEDVNTTIRWLRQALLIESEVIPDATQTIAVSRRRCHQLLNLIDRQTQEIKDLKSTLAGQTMSRWQSFL